jgi:hypothetical protein
MDHSYVSASTTPMHVVFSPYFFGLLLVLNFLQDQPRGDEAVDVAADAAGAEGGAQDADQGDDDGQQQQLAQQVRVLSLVRDLFQLCVACGTACMGSCKHSVLMVLQDSYTTVVSHQRPTAGINTIGSDHVLRMAKQQV